MRDFNEIYNINKKNKEIIAKHTQETYNQEILGPRRLARELRAILHPQDIIALDNGLYKVRLARNYRAAEPNTVLLDNALATM
jgi:thiamine pyrophosphate-dependent acetolactate synthase large subunit-like protein